MIYIVLAEKPAFGRFHCYSAPSTAALQRRSDDCASMTEPWWHHNGTCRLLAKECARRARASLLSLCWASSWRCLHFAAAAEVPLRARERKRLLLGIEPPFYTCTHNNMPGISHSSSVNTQQHGIYFRKSGNPCGALLRRNKSFCLLWHSLFDVLQ